jgi:uncharacterized protein YkwD
MNHSKLIQITSKYIILAMCAGFSACKDVDEPAYQIHEFERRVFELTNLEREKQGLPPFLWHNTLAHAAREHSRDMSETGVLTHTGSDGSTIRERIERAGITDATSWSEVASRGRRTPEAVVEAWMASDGHRGNLLHPTRTHTGVGFIEGTGNLTYWWTMKFVTLK